MMKRLFRFLIIAFCIFSVGFSLTQSTWKVKAEEPDNIDERLKNFKFNAELILTNTNKVHCTITWETTTPIVQLKVNAVLPNNKEQLVYDSFRANSAGKWTYIKVNDIYVNNLEIDVYHYQVGTMRLDFEYAFELFVPPHDEIIKCTYYFAAGTWAKKQSAIIAILTGCLVTVCSGIATYVIIENSQRSIVGLEEIDENEMDEVDE